MIKIYSTPRSTVAHFAEYVEDLINEKTAKSNEFFIALSGGSTPQLLFNELKNKYLQHIDWSMVHFFWGDERCVNPDSTESNYGNASKLFLNYINIPEENIHRIHGEDEAATEAKRYSSEILMNVPAKNKLPNFDLVMLGIGTDGHIASIFPDQMNLLKSENICEVAIQPESEQKRITITGKVINNAKNIAILVTGSEKSTVISEIINKKNNYNKYPASYINPKTGNIIWYMDKSSSRFL